MTTLNTLSMPISSSNAVTMSSREIAELTGKQHAHVMRDIRAMLEQIGEGQSKFGSTYLDAQGKARDCYNLPKNLTITLIAGYRADMRLKIIDRWMELEAQQVPNIVPAQLTAREFGGIVKSVVTKMKSDLLAELKAEIRGQLTPAQQELSDHAVAVVKEKIAEKQVPVETRIPGQIAAFRLPADLIPKRRPNTGTCRLPVGEVARRLGIGTVKVNAMLADLGLQSPGTTNQPWMVTDNGEFFGVQSTKRLILWSARALDALRWKMEQEGASVPFAKSPEPATT